ncbi:MFS transporter [Streptomyces monashensis]|uniref:MFS transporter n=1 Tax=Streptomyces monashensis TaxID=1678012 RepID=UPI0033DF0EAE
MRKWAPLIAVCLGIFMLLLDVTIVAVALPDLEQSLHTSLSDLEWVMDAYAIALAALLLGAGSVADIVGRRKVYLVGLVLFTASSVVCGLAGNGTVLVAARGVQGIGGAAMLATTLSLLSSIYVGRDRAVAFGAWGAVSGAAAASGPILGGLLTQGLDWRWIFLVNIPVGMAALLLTLNTMPESKGRHVPRLDIPGLVTFTAFIAATVYALIKAASDGWGSAHVFGFLIGGAAALVLFLVIEVKSAHPMLDVRLFRRPAFVAIMTGTFAMQCAAFACIVYISVWLQTVLGLSPIRAGLSLIPLAICSFVVAGVGSRLLHGVRPRWTIGVGLLLIAGGAFTQAHLDASSDWASLLPGLIMVGVGVGLANPAVSNAAMEAAPRDRAGMAAGAANTFRQLGYALGVAVFGTLLVNRTEHVISDHGVPGAHGVAQAATGGGAQSVIGAVPLSERAAAAHVLREAVASGLNTAEITAGSVGLLGALLVLFLVKNHQHHEAPAESPAAGGVAAAPRSEVPQG